MLEALSYHLFGVLEDCCSKALASAGNDQLDENTKTLLNWAIKIGQDPVLSSDFRTAYFLAFCYQRLGQIENATSLYNKAVVKAPAMASSEAQITLIGDRYSGTYAIWYLLTYYGKTVLIDDIVNRMETEQKGFVTLQNITKALAAYDISARAVRLSNDRAVQMKTPFIQYRVPIIGNDLGYFVLYLPIGGGKTILLDGLEKPRIVEGAIDDSKVSFSDGSIIIVQKGREETTVQSLPYEVLEPQDWLGKELPIFDHIDIGDQLKTGSWLIVLYHYGCPSCTEAISKIEQLAGEMGDKGNGLNFAIIEVPPYGPQGVISANSGSLYSPGKLDVSKEWFVITPTILFVESKIVKQSWKEVVPDTQELDNILTQVSIVSANNPKLKKEEDGIAIAALTESALKKGYNVALTDTEMSNIYGGCAACIVANYVRCERPSYNQCNYIWPTFCYGMTTTGCPAHGVYICAGLPTSLPCSSPELPCPGVETWWICEGPSGWMAGCNVSETMYNSCSAVKYEDCTGSIP